MTAEGLLLHLTLEATICDHMGDMANSLINAFELLGLPPPETDDDGDFDSDKLEARGARWLRDVRPATPAPGLTLVRFPSGLQIWLANADAYLIAQVPGIDIKGRS
jgi:hypothetical protein